MSNINNRRLFLLDFIRVLSFIFVMLSHTGYRLFEPLGALAVELFLIMSGFLLTIKGNVKIPTNVKEAVQCVKSRINKLYPLHMFCTFCFIPMEFSGHYQLPLSVVLFKLFGDTFLITQLISTQGSLNSPAWFLSTIAFCYLLFPFIYKFFNSLDNGNKIKKFISIIILLEFFIFIIPLILFLFSTSNLLDYNNQLAWFIYYFPPVRSLDFMLGCLIGIYFKKYSYKLNELNIKRFLRLSVFLLITLYLIIVILIDYVNLRYISHSNTESVLFLWSRVFVWALPCTMLIYSAANLDHYISFLSCPIKFISSISGNGFLLHGLVFSVLGGFVKFFNLFDWNLYSSMVCVAVGIPITLFLSYLYELFYNNYKRRRYDKILH